MEEEPAIQLESLSGLFDLFLAFGLDVSPIDDILNNLVEYLTCDDLEMRTVAATGFAKLLLAHRIESSSVLQQLILLFFNPVTKDDSYIRQFLSVFFSAYLCTAASFMMWKEAFMPTLQIVLAAPSRSPLSEIDVVHMGHVVCIILLIVFI